MPCAAVEVHRDKARCGAATSSSDLRRQILSQKDNDGGLGSRKRPQTQPVVKAFTDYSQVDIRGLRYKFGIFAVGKSPGGVLASLTTLKLTSCVFGTNLTTLQRERGEGGHTGVPRS